MKENCQKLFKAWTEIRNTSKKIRVFTQNNKEL